MAPVIGYGISQDRDQAPKITNPHGFSIEWLKLPPGQSVSRFRIEQKQVLISLHRQHRRDAQRARRGGRDATRRLGHRIDPGAGVALHPQRLRHRCRGLRDHGGRRPQGAGMGARGAARVRAAGRGVDKSGFIAPAHLLPSYALGRQ